MQLRLIRCLGMQFGHLFAKGDTREGAIRAMVVALKEVKIRGEIRTTVDYCVEMIQSPDFVGNNIHTGWLDARISSHVGAPPPQLRQQQQQACRVHACYVWKGRLSLSAGIQLSCLLLEAGRSMVNAMKHHCMLPCMRGMLKALGCLS